MKVHSLEMNLRNYLVDSQHQHSFLSGYQSFPVFTFFPIQPRYHFLSFQPSLTSTLPQRSPSTTSGKAPTLDESNYRSSLVAKHCWKSTQIGVTINHWCHSKFMVSDFKWTPMLPGNPSLFPLSALSFSTVALANF